MYFRRCSQQNKQCLKSEFEKILNDLFIFRSQEERRHRELHLKMIMELVFLRAVFLQVNLSILRNLFQ